LRIARAHPEILDGQLAALAAAAQGVPGCDLWVMAPMVATPAEAAGFVSQARAAEVALAADSPAAGRGAVRALPEVIEQVWRQLEQLHGPLSARQWPR